MTISKCYNKGSQQYATRIDYHEDDKVGPFLAVYLTHAGVEMLGKQYARISKQLYDPKASAAPQQWKGFKKPLKQALKKLNLMPSGMQT